MALGHCSCVKKKSTDVE